MAILRDACGVCVIDHEKLISTAYSDVSCENEDQKKYRIVPGLFSIFRPFIVKKSMKRKAQQEDVDDSESEVSMVKKSFKILMKNMKDAPHIEKDASSDIDAKELSKRLFEKTKFDFGVMQGGNNSSVPLKCIIKNEFYLIPPYSRFLCGDVREQVKKLTGEKYNMIIADPPWWNKYIRRLKTANQLLSYSMMYNEDIASIPLAPLLADSCVVAVWCTNSPSNIDAVKKLIFPAWRVTYAATWYWLKVTKLMEPICSFGTGHMKQPYERIILGTMGNVANIPDKKLIVSVPSALHSHKPPLTELLSRYVINDGSSPRMLELFARYLLPNTTSIGFEPLKWQHMSLYEEVK